MAEGQMILESEHFEDEELITTRGLLPDGRAFRFAISPHAVALVIEGDERPTVTQRRQGRTWGQQARDVVDVVELLEGMDV